MAATLTTKGAFLMAISRRSIRLVVVVLVFATALLVAPPAARAQPSPGEINAQLGVGVNLGNALEAPREGDWGLTLEADFFREIADAGFGHVRVPIKFSAYANTFAPYTIPDADATVRNANSLWERIDWVLDQAEANGLYAIIDLHHYDELFDDVPGHRDRFLAIWQQIAERYADRPASVLFELLNEPHGQFNDDPALWNGLLAEALSLVRLSNPERTVFVGPTQWNGIYALDDLELPSDPNLIVSVHFYSPFPFTHQGADWVDPVPATPATFDADLIDFGPAFNNWSWATQTQRGIDGLTVTYERQWAGLNFGRPDGIDPATLRVEIDGDAELSVRCINDAEEVEVTRIVTVDGGSVHDLDMSACPARTESFAFMTASPTFDTLVYRSAEVCDASGVCDRMLETASEAIATELALAAEWSRSTGHSINVGEFGAYSANGVASMSERAEWTTLVRTIGRSYGFSMSYWEFGAGFGVYDPTTDSWNTPLLDALDPDSVTRRRFVDVPPGLFYSDAVQWAVDAGVTSGTTAITFSPSRSLSRGELAMFLWRLAGEPAVGGGHGFADVAPGAYYEQAVTWLTSTGITQGTSATTFSPSKSVTRAEMATFLWRGEGSPSGFGHGFSDVASPSFYETAVGWMVSQGITRGTSTTSFSPGDFLTRAEAVTMLWRQAN